jgi:hypothetical protein
MAMAMAMALASAAALEAGCADGGPQAPPGDAGAGSVPNAGDDPGPGWASSGREPFDPDEPRLMLAPAELDFGVVPVGTEGSAMTVSVTLLGKYPSVFLKAIETSAPDFQVLRTTCVQPLEPGNSCAVTVTFTPVGPGQRAGTLNVSSPPLRAASRLRGVGRAADPVVLAPASALFGEVAVGSVSAAIAFTLTNRSSPTAMRPAITTTADFTVTRDGCVAELPPGAGCTVEVVFAPSVVGPRAGALTASVGNLLLTAGLGGRGQPSPE